MQSSLRQQFGLGTDPRRIPPAERGVAKMMVNLYDIRGAADARDDVRVAQDADERRTAH
jgi:hypothetical protein